MVMADGNGGDPFVLVGSEENGLYLLSGNWNGDTGVSIFDFPTFAYWFAKSVPNAPAYVDLNGDLGVSIFDFPIFAANFGQRVTFPIGLQFGIRTSCAAASRRTTSQLGSGVGFLDRDQEFAVGKTGGDNRKKQIPTTGGRKTFLVRIQTSVVRQPAGAKHGGT